MLHFKDAMGGYVFSAGRHRQHPDPPRLLGGHMRFCHSSAGVKGESLKGLELRFLVRRDWQNAALSRGSPPRKRRRRVILGSYALYALTKVKFQTRRNTQGNFYNTAKRRKNPHRVTQAISA